MDLAEYFGQDEHYFSESEGQLLRLDDMAFPHVYHAYQKLLTEFGQEFRGTALQLRMWWILHPDPQQIREALKVHGSVAYMYSDHPSGGTTEARGKLYAAAKRGGMKVSTHKKNGWLIAERVDANIKVSAH